MPRIRQTDEPRAVAATRFAARIGWVVLAAITVPALLLGTGSAILLFAILAALWQVLAWVVASAVGGRNRPLRTRMRFRITDWGVVYGVITVGFFLLALRWGINLFSLTASFMFAGLGCTALLALTSLSNLGVEYHLPAHVFAGDTFPTEVRLTNRKRALSACGLTVGGSAGNGAPTEGHHLWRLAPGEEALLTVHQCAPSRGLQQPPAVAVRSSFPFGLTEVTWTAQPRKETLVLPHLGTIHTESLLRRKGPDVRWVQLLRRREQEGEFSGLREYQPGDDPRHIHWATSARLQKLYVREFEKQEAQGVLILLDASLAEGRPEDSKARQERFESAVSFVGTLAALLTARNVFYAFASYCRGPIAMPYHSGQGHMFTLLEVLAEARMTGERGLGGLLGALDRRQVHGGVCLVTPGPCGDLAGAMRLDPQLVCVDVSQPEFNEYFSV